MTLTPDRGLSSFLFEKTQDSFGLSQSIVPLLVSLAPLLQNQIGLAKCKVKKQSLTTRQRPVFLDWWREIEQGCTGREQQLCIVLQSIFLHSLTLSFSYCLPFSPCFYLHLALSLSVFLFQILPACLSLSPLFPLNLCLETWHWPWSITRLQVLGL